MEEVYDTIIIGTGSGGYPAAIYSARYKLKTLMIGKVHGGMLTEAHVVENYPGFKSISGVELLDKFKEQVIALGVEIVENEVVRIEKENDLFLVNTRGKQYTGKTIIITIGAEKRRLNAANEDKFIGKGVSYCATCDAPFFRNKTVAVVGGNDASATSAILLSQFAKKVYIIYRGEELRAEPIHVEKIKNEPKIEIIYKANVVSINGNNFVESVTLDNGSELKVDGVFIEIGSVPSTILLKQLGVKLNESNYIEINEKSETSISGVFAAGDITNIPLKQSLTAAAYGATAALGAYKFIKGIKK